MTCTHEKDFLEPSRQIFLQIQSFQFQLGCVNYSLEAQSTDDFSIFSGFIFFEQFKACKNILNLVLSALFKPTDPKTIETDEDVGMLDS